MTLIRSTWLIAILLVIGPGVAPGVVPSVAQSMAAGVVMSPPVDVPGWRRGVLDARSMPAARPMYLDPGVADLGPLSMSLRVLNPGLHQETGFERVFQLPGAGHLYMRSDGGIYAVFPRSAYRMTRDGEVPLIPAGTVFHIGEPNVGVQPPLDELPPTAVRPRMASDGPEPTINEVRTEDLLNARLRQPPREDSIYTEGAYRSGRLAEILQRAVTGMP